MKKVQGRERPKQTRLQEQHETKINLRPIFRAPRGNHCHRRHDCGQQEHQQSQAIGCNPVFDAERGDPEMSLFKLQRAGRSIKGVPQAEDGCQRQETDPERQRARRLLVIVAQTNNNHAAQQRQQSQERYEGQTVHEERAPQINQITSTVSATPITRR